MTLIYHITCILLMGAFLSAVVAFLVCLALAFASLKGIIPPRDDDDYDF